MQKECVEWRKKYVETQHACYKYMAYMYGEVFVCK